MAAYTTVKKPRDYFHTIKYNGSNGDQAITGVGFAPDWMWLKCTTTGYHHRIFDRVRGVNKNIRSNGTFAEQDIAEGITTFGSDGFTVTQGSNLEYNASGQSYVGWNWKAGGGSTSSNTDGDITSNISANSTAGFNIVSYTGTGQADDTIGHGLGVTPAMIIVKNRSITENWRVWHKKLAGSTSKLALDSNGQADTSSTVFNGQSSTTFTVGNDPSVNGSGNNIIAYCFKEVRGFSKFGIYTGNGDGDGTFVYTGFQPAWGMFKMINGSGDWGIWDNVRDGGYRDQPIYKLINANSTAAEQSSYASYQIDFVSTGFKIRNTLGEVNSDGNRFIYMAFAELPLVGDSPVTAR